MLKVAPDLVKSGPVAQILLKVPQIWLKVAPDLATVEVAKILLKVAQIWLKVAPDLATVKVAQILLKVAPDLV